MLTRNIAFKYAFVILIMFSNENIAFLWLMDVY